MTFKYLYFRECEVGFVCYMQPRKTYSSIATSDMTTKDKIKTTFREFDLLNTGVLLREYNGA